jgi:quinol-cytochrome oxidoreductase complex cytochrome b subunit
MQWVIIILAIFVLFCMEYLQKTERVEIVSSSWKRPLRWGVYYLFVCSILFFGFFGNQPFIYFQF